MVTLNQVGETQWRFWVKPTDLQLLCFVSITCMKQLTTSQRFSTGDLMMVDVSTHDSTSLKHGSIMLTSQWSSI